MMAATSYRICYYWYTLIMYEYLVVAGGGGGGGSHTTGSGSAGGGAGGFRTAIRISCCNCTTHYCRTVGTGGGGWCRWRKLRLTVDWTIDKWWHSVFSLLHQPVVVAVWVMRSGCYGYASCWLVLVVVLVVGTCNTRYILVVQ